MTLDQQIRAKQDSIAQLMTVRDKAVGIIQNDIYVSWNSYQSRIDALGRTGSMNAHDQAAPLKVEQQEAFKQLGAQKMQIEAEFETKLNVEYQAIKALENEKKQIEREQFEAKLKERQERDEAARRENERWKQLTPEQRKEEEKARFEAKLKEMKDRSPDRER